MSLVGEIYGGYFPCRVVYVRAIACCLVDREQIPPRVGRLSDVLRAEPKCSLQPALTHY